MSGFIPLDPVESETMKANVILNPYANRWGAKSKLPLLHSALKASGMDYELVQTDRPGQATTAAMAAAQSGMYDAVVAAGGDGTLNEVLNGLIRAAGDGPTIPLGVLPIGTGNDFSDMAGLPRDIEEAARTIVAGHTRQVDAGQVNDHYFCNNCALAMEPMVTIENVKIKRLSGNMRYIVALIKGLIKLKAWQMRISWDDGGYEGPVYLLSICNSPRTGGVFMMYPPAKIDDGLFNYVLAPELSKLQVLAILPRLFGGSHINHPRVSHGATTQLTVESEPGTPIHADGEVIAESVKHIEYQILPGKLTLLTPSAS